MITIYVGIDNGVTGSIGVVGSDFDGGHRLYQIPTKSEQSYTRRKQQITRVDFDGLLDVLRNIRADYGTKGGIRAFIERPFTAPGAFKATVSGMRCLEAVLIAVEDMGWSYEYVDSRQWQRDMLPRGLKGAKELKPASRDIGTRLFPSLADEIAHQKDADALLIAEWARRHQL